MWGRQPPAGKICVEMLVWLWLVCDMAWILAQFLLFRVLIRPISEGARAPGDQVRRILIRLIVQHPGFFVVEIVSRSGAVWKDVVWPFDILLQKAVEGQFTCVKTVFQSEMLRIIPLLSIGPALDLCRRCVLLLLFKESNLVTPSGRVLSFSVGCAQPYVVLQLTSDHEVERKQDHEEHNEARGIHDALDRLKSFRRFRQCKCGPGHRLTHALDSRSFGFWVL